MPVGPQEQPGSLSLDVRLQRIEAMLDRLDEKLDIKASEVELERLTNRVDTLEHVGSNNAQAALRAAEKLEDRVARIERYMARYPQDRVDAAIAGVEDLQSGKKYRAMFWGSAVAVITSLAAAAAAIGAFFHG